MCNAILKVHQHSCHQLLPYLGALELDCDEGLQKHSVLPLCIPIALPQILLYERDFTAKM